MSDETLEQDSEMRANAKAGQAPASPFSRLKRNPVIGKAVWCVAAIIGGVILVAPFYFSNPERTGEGKTVWNVLVTHDMPNHFRYMESFDHSLKSGIIQPRWFADVNNGYGNPTFDFYPRNLYYLTSLVHLFVNDWVLTLFVVSALALAGSGLALYKLSRLFFGRQASLVGAIVYVLLPIHMLDLYWRGGITQFVGYVSLPLDLYFAYRVGRDGRARDYAGLGIVYGFHLLTHMPVAYLFTYTLAAYAVLWAIRARDSRILFRIGCGMAIGLLLSATYWLPAAVYTKDTFEAYYNTSFPYHYQYISPLPASDLFDRLIQGSFYFNIVALIAAMVTLRYVQRPAGGTPEVVSTNDAPAGAAQLQTRLWVILCAATIFMTTSYSYYVSVLIPKIQIAVPPFRWLAISCLFMALLVAACVDRLKHSLKLQPRKAMVYSLVLGAALALNFWVSVKGTIIGALSLPAFHRPGNMATVTDDGFAPRGATLARDLPDTPLVVAEPEGASTEVVRWDPEDRLVYVNANVPTTVRLKTYYFPGWAARIDGQPAPLLRDQDGIQLVSVGPGIHHVEVSYVNTFPRSLGDAISLAALLVIIGLSLSGYFGGRKEDAARLATEHPSVDARPGASAEPSKPQSSHRKPATKWILMFALVFGVAMLLLVRQLGSPSRSKSSNDSAVSGQNDPAVAAEVRVFLPGRDSVPIAVDEKALNDLVQALSAGSADLTPMVESRRVFVVPNNTRTRILERGSTSIKIRVLEGQHIMAEGLVSERWIH